MPNKRKAELRKAGVQFPQRHTKPTLRKWGRVARGLLAFESPEKIAKIVGYKDPKSITRLESNPEFQVFYKQIEDEILSYEDERIIKKRKRIVGKAIDLAPDALEVQKDLMKNQDGVVPHSIQQRASADILDRAGVTSQRHPTLPEATPPPAALIQQLNVLMQVIKETDERGPTTTFTGHRPAQPNKSRGSSEVVEVEVSE